MITRKFRKKSIVVEAVQLTWQNWGAICDFVPRPWFVGGVYLDPDGKPMPDGVYRFEAAGEKPNAALGLRMRTQNTQEFVAVGGDWIIKGIDGEFYPCAPEIFEKTYEEVTALEAASAELRERVRKFLEEKIDSRFRNESYMPESVDAIAAFVAELQRDWGKS